MVRCARVWNLTALLAALLPALLLAGCTTLGPDFKAPDVAAPPAFRSAAPAPAASLTVVPERWWLLLGDAQLDALEQDALAASPTLQVALERAERARALLAGSRADEQPRLLGDAAAQRFRTSREVATAPQVQGRRLAIESEQFSLQTSLTWELDLWGRVRRQTEVAQAQLDAATLDAAAARLALTSDVATAWLLLRALDDEMRAVAAARANRRDALQVVQQRFDAGSTHEGDVQRASSELATVDADLAELARRRALAENALSMLSGRAPGALGFTAPLPEPPPVQAGLPAQVLQRRPDVAQALALLQAASAQIGVAEAAFYPSIRLTGSAGLASDDLVSLLSAPARLFSLGPALSIPLLDGGRNRANLEAVQAQHREALAQLRQRVLQALREVDDALADLAARQDIAAAQARALAANTRLQRVARLRYEQGAASYLEVTDADRSALASQRALAQVRAAQWQGTVQLVRALGGGWGGP